jgi:hypothetical protein
MSASGTGWRALAFHIAAHPAGRESIAMLSPRAVLAIGQIVEGKGSSRQLARNQRIFPKAHGTCAWQYTGLCSEYSEYRIGMGDQDTTFLIA